MKWYRVKFVSGGYTETTAYSIAEAASKLEALHGEIRSIELIG